MIQEIPDQYWSDRYSNDDWKIYSYIDMYKDHQNKLRRQKYDQRQKESTQRLKKLINKNWKRFPHKVAA